VVPRLAFSMGLLLCAAPSFAQMYKWVDDKGVTHYSESPPPGRKAQQIQATPSPTPSPSATPKPAEPASTWSDKERAFRQRTIEREYAEETKRKKDAERIALRREACLEARYTINTLNSGGPVYKLNEKGEREYLADSVRAEKLQRAKENAETYCKPE
jgi:uncharacterized protein DUF4124